MEMVSGHMWQQITAQASMHNFNSHNSTRITLLRLYSPAAGNMHQLVANQVSTLSSCKPDSFNAQAVELLREVASVSPAVYEQQQQADAAGVRIVASFIAELADR